MTTLPWGQQVSGGEFTSGMWPLTRMSVAHQKRTWAIPGAHLMHVDAPKAHLQVRSRCAPKAHQMVLNKIVRTKSAPIWLSHIHSAPNQHLKNFTFFYNASGAHQTGLNKIVCTKSAPIWLSHFHSAPNQHLKKLKIFLQRTWSAPNGLKQNCVHQKRTYLT